MGLTPIVRVLADQVDITAAVLSRMVSITVTDESGTKSDTVEIVLADHDPTAALAIPSTGAELDVFVGYDGMPAHLGLYVVDEVEVAGWPGTMTIRGKAAPFTTGKGGKTDLQTQKSRSWPAGTTLSDLVAKIASEHGMEPAVSQSLADKVLPHLAQTEESDMSFLVRVARRFDAIAKPAGGKIVMAKRGESKSASGQSLPPIVVHPSENTSYRMTIATRESKGTVIAYWHDRRANKRHEVKIGDGEPVRRMRQWYPDEATAREAAQSEVGRRERGEHKLSLTLPGNPGLMAESPLVAVGFRPGVDGEWLVTRVVHNITKAGGYVCDLEAEKPGGGGGK